MKFNPLISYSDASTAALPNTISTTLHDHLNRCRSQAGKTLIRNFYFQQQNSQINSGDWLRRPLFSLPEIEERLNVVEALFTSASARQSLHEDLLRRVPDIALLTRKLIQKKATLQVPFPFIWKQHKFFNLGLLSNVSIHLIAGQDRTCFEKYGKFG